MPLRDYVVGLAYFLPTAGAVSFATVLVVRRRYSYLRGAEVVLAFSLILAIGLITAHVIPLALGVLARGSVLVCALALAVAGWFVPATDTSPDPSPEAPPSGRASLTIAVLAVATAAVFELARVRTLAVLPIDHIDALNFHLPGVARWIQSGSLWQIDQLFPLFATGSYPNDGDALTLAVMLPWHDAAFARFVEVPFLAFTGLSVYALARELRAAATLAAIFAAAVVTIPSLSHEALLGLPDVIMLFGLGAGTTFLVRHARSARVADLIIAGLGLGLAFGTKWYGVTSAAAVVLVWAIASLWARRAPRETLRQGAVLVGLILLAGGIWLVRNLVEAGNPLYPKTISLLGQTIFQGSHGAVLDRYGFTVAHYLGDFGVLRQYVFPALIHGLGIAGVLALVGVILALVRRIGRQAATGPAATEAVAAAVAVASILILGLYLVTPGSAYGLPGEPSLVITTIRWLVPAPMLAAAVAAAVFTYTGRFLLLFELAGFAAVVDGIRRAHSQLGSNVSLSTSLEAAALLVILGGLAFVAFRRRDTLGRAARHQTAGVSVIALFVLALVAVIGRLDEQSFARNQHLYGDQDPTIAWIQQNAPAGHRIGLAGLWSVNGISPVFPSFGPRLRNEVSYVGPVSGHLLRQYTTRPTFAAALRRGGYDILLVGRGQPPKPHVPEERWAQTAGFRPVVASDRLALLERTPSD